MLRNSIYLLLSFASYQIFTTFANEIEITSFLVFLKSTNIAINKSIKHTTMEATIQSTNRAINNDINVSINVDALKAIKQRVLSAVAKLSIFNFQFSIWHIYRQELRMTRAVAAWCDRHNTLVNWLMAIQVMTFAFYVFMFV